MHTPVPGKRRIAVVSLVAAAALAGGTQLALADGGGAAAPKPGKTSGTPHAPKTDGSKQLCKRLPKVDARVERALGRLGGGATVRGSVDRMKARVTKAKSAGHTEIATYLNHKLTARTSMATTLRERQEDLKGVKTWCQDNNNGKPAAKGAQS